jgi:hypothetical protein
LEGGMGHSDVLLQTLKGARWNLEGSGENEKYNGKWEIHMKYIWKMGNTNGILGKLGIYE